MKNIINKASYKIAVWCDEDATEEEIEILTYGFDLVFESAYKFILLITIAFLTNMVFETVIVIGSFCTLRYFAGGFHCKTSIGCTCFVFAVWLLGLGAGFMRFHIAGIIVMLLMSVLITIWLAPCTTNNNPIKDIYTVKRKHTGAVITVCILSIVSIILALCGYLSVAGFIAVPIFIEALTLIPLRKGGNTYENAKGSI